MEQVRYAKIAVSAATYAIDKPYTYRFPQELAERAQVGMRVLVPFARGNRLTEGIILSMWDGSLMPNLKSVHTLLDECPVLNEEGVRLALWMRDWYFCTVYDAVRAMLPAGLFYALKDQYVLSKDVSFEQALEATANAPLQKKALEVLQQHDGRATREQICTAFGSKDPHNALRALQERGLILRTTSTSRHVGDKTESIARLACPLEEALEKVSKTAKARRAVLKLLDEVGSASIKEIHYFTGTSASTVKTLEKLGLVTLFPREVFRSPKHGSDVKEMPPVLNDEQQEAYEALCADVRSGQPSCSLLYGVTGSGKTQVYIRLIHEVLHQGKTALVLVPEIALTPQILQKFEAQFGEQVAILHSALSAGERYDEWKRVRNGQAKVVIGTRSAVFAPLEKLGLIVLDEEQESSYKSEQSPRYHAREIAKFRCSQTGATLVLGSATPCVESMYQARKQVYRLLTLKKRYNEQAMPLVHVVDMKEELRSGHAGLVSRPLAGEIQKNLERGEQSILFLNRRGTSRMVVCALCGESPECPNCSVKLTYHKDNQRLMCHHCGYSQLKPDICPRCGGELLFVDAGVQMVQEELNGLFPGTEVLRMDADSVSARNTHEQLLGRFVSEKIPILLGTQMVAKGLDFEGVTLVGVLEADMSLYVNHYRAGERTFALLTQVVGRAGRGCRSGRAVIQTYTPQNDVIVHAANQDYDAFYQSEILLREMRSLPPFADQYVLTFSGLQERQVLCSAHRMKSALDVWRGNEEVRPGFLNLYGPAEAPVLRVMGRYRYKLTLVCHNNKKIREMLAFLLQTFRQDPYNKGVSVAVDLNPMD